jgi:GNAT superfamily N-acetyltransferase
MLPDVTRRTVTEGGGWSIERLHGRHDRKTFCSGVPELDEYLQRYAGQNDRARVSQHFVAVASPGQGRVLGYYALSAGSVAFEVLPDDLRKRLPRYPIPVGHIGRLAVDRSMQGRGLGAYLLIDAVARIARVADEVAIHAVEVVAINPSARKFYLKYGFIPLADDENHLYLPLSAVRKLGLS